MSKAQAASQWCAKLDSAVECDGWGQVEEASEGYERLTMLMTEQAPGGMSAAEQGLVAQLVACLAARVQQLHSTALDQSPSAQDMKALQPVLRGVFSGATSVPAQFARHAGAGVAAAASAASAAAIAAVPDQGASGHVPTLLPPLPGLRPGTSLQIQIEKVGLKDAEEYIDPFFLVSMYDSEGRALCAHQKTALALRRRPQYVNFECSVHAQVALDKIPAGSALCFEFIHYKQKKDKWSCRAWAFVESEDLVAGPQVLELYQKPLDPKRKPKKIKLFTEKELYLHINLAIT